MTIVDPMQPQKRTDTPALLKSRTVSVPKPQIISSIAVPVPPPVPAKRMADKSLKPAANPKKTIRRRWPQVVLLTVMIVLLMIMPEFISQLILVMYGVIAIIRRFVVGLTFGVAILVLLLSPLFGLITGSSGNGAILASYSFGLLLIGFIQLIIEYRRMLHK